MCLASGPASGAVRAIGEHHILELGPGTGTKPLQSLGKHY